MIDIDKCHFDLNTKMIRDGDVQVLLTILREIPLSLPNHELWVGGHSTYLRILPYRPREIIDQISINYNNMKRNDNRKVELDYASPTSYRLRYGRITIDIEKRNSEGLLEEQISNLEERVKELSSEA